MHTPECKPRTHPISDLCFRASRYSLSPVVCIVPLVTLDLAQRVRKSGRGSSRPGLVKADEPKAGSAKSAPDLQRCSGRLPPGSGRSSNGYRVDEPQLYERLFH